jgi:hypothetical protein
LIGGHNKASSDPAEIDRLWREARAYIAKIAARQGLPFPLPDPAIGGSSHDLIIFDLDGPEGIEEFMSASDGSGFGEPHIVKSGRKTTGYHYTYKIPANLDEKLKDKLTIWRPGDGHIKGTGGLDGRCNGRGYVVLPPSMHKSGQRYVEIDPRDPGECPDDLLDLAFTKIAASHGQTKDDFLRGAQREPRRRESSEASKPRSRQSTIRQGSRLERMSAGAEGLWSPRTEQETALVRLAIQTIDPQAFTGLTDRPNINQEVWRNCIWSLRAWGEFWRDEAFALDLALTWSREFASQDEVKFFDQFWNFRSTRVEFGRRELLKQATAAKPNWRDAVDPRLSVEAPAIRSNAVDAPVQGVYESAPVNRPDAVILQFPPAPVQSEARPLEKGPGALPDGDSDVVGPIKGQTFADMRLGAFCTTRITYHHLNRERKPATGDGRNAHEAFRIWKINFRYDRFTRHVWAFFADGSKKKVDAGFMATIYDLLVKTGLTTNKTTLYNIIEGLAWSDEFDMAKAWLDTIPAWDGVERARSLFIRVFGVPDDEYHRALGALFAAQLVRRILRPGYKSDYMITIKSDEGMKKSTFFSKVVPHEFFTDSLQFGMDEKKIIEQTEGVLLAEMPELINIGRKEVEHCKHQISRQNDKSRLAFGRETETFPRYFTMVGSTNDAKPLQSRTGNRRFLIMDVNQVADTDWLEENFLQIWAEFKEIERTYGPALDIPFELRATAAKKQDDSLDYSPLEEYLYDQISEIKRGFLPNEELYAFLGFKDVKEANLHKNAVSLAKAALKRAGWTTSFEEKDPRTGQVKIIDRLYGMRGHFIGDGAVRYKTFCVDGSRVSAKIVPFDYVHRENEPDPSAPVGGGPGGNGVEGFDASVSGSDTGGLSQADNGGAESQDRSPVQFNSFEPLAAEVGHTVFVGGASPGPGVRRAPVVYDPSVEQPRRDGPS